MAYATIPDMIAAFGERELVQLSTADGADMAVIDEGRVNTALDIVSGNMDSYLRRRYAVPVPTTPELVACCADLARLRLSNTGSAQATDQVRAAAKMATAWLEGIAAGRVTLDGAAPAGPLSGARVQDRIPVFGPRGRLH